MQSSKALAHPMQFFLFPCTLQPQKNRQTKTIRIPFGPGRLNSPQSPSTLSETIEPSPEILHFGCSLFHHASKDFSSARIFEMLGCQVEERARWSHSEMNLGRPTFSSFFCCLKPSFSSNMAHNLRSSTQRSPNGGSFVCSI